MKRNPRSTSAAARCGATVVLTAAFLFVATIGETAPAKGKKKDRKSKEDPYAEYVWPPPPNQPRIKLEQVIDGRAAVETRSRLRRSLLGAAPQSPYDRLKKPFAAAIDSRGRVLVTDPGLAAVIRFDVDGRRMDVFGTRGTIALKLPLGLGLGPDDTLYVADASLQQVVAFDPEGRVKAAYGRPGELENPTDAAVSPDGTRLFVADSKAHKIAVYDLADGRLLSSFGRAGDGEGEFSFPTSLVFGPEGDLFIVDQINARIQVFAEDGEFLDTFGQLGVGFGNFVRPKDVAVDEAGFVYVSDNAYNNVQLFDADFTLLTFVGSGGRGPGQFHGASGVGVRGSRLAVVDQLGRRVQLFRFLVPKEE